MYGTNLNYDSRFFVSGQELSGIQSLNISYANSASVINPLGFANGVTTIGGPTKQTVSLGRYLIYEDPFFPPVGEGYTGNSPLTGSIHYGDVSYGFQSGYLDNYSLKCAVGQVPQVNTTFSVYDEMRTGYSASGSVAHPDIEVPSQGSITATCNNSTTNRVIGFDYSLKCNRKAYYTIGSETAREVKVINPMQITASVQIDVDDAFMESGYSFLGTGKESRTVVFQVKSRDGNNILWGSAVPNACLVGENLTASADGSLTLQLDYMGHSAG
jgi:hypothetical protein|tara:strand:+ start:415 stop:1227 length:813 start_codon:yes stop_codon:yes gene_type:complete